MKVRYILIISYGAIAVKHISIIKRKYKSIKIIVYRSGKGVRKVDKNVDIVINSLKESLKYNISEVLICSPSINHLKEIKYFSSLNKKIFVEKPLTNLNISNEIISLKNNKKLIFQIGYVLKFDDSLNYFKKLVKDGFVGKILSVNINASSYLPDWRNIDYSKSVSANSKLGGGVLLELSHEIDYILWIFDKIKSVFALFNKSNTLKINTEDSADIFLKTNSNYNIIVNLNFNQKKNQRFCKVIGSDGEIKIDLLTKKVSTNNYKNNKVKRVTFSQNKKIMYENQLNYFFNLKSNSSKNINSLNSALATQKLLYNIILSNKNKKYILTS